MPELPEVETVVRDLRQRLVGRIITGVEIFWESAVGAPSPEAFRTDLLGRRIVGVDRRGKFVVLHLEREDLLVHLRMTGQLLLAEAGETPACRHLRVALALDGQRLLFNDVRKFGRMYLVPDAQVWLGDLGPEPLGSEFTAVEMEARLRGRRGAIKSLLLSQRFVAGVGNIYADESLHAAHIAPHRPAGSLSRSEIEGLHAAIRAELQRAIDNRGTTLSNYRDAKGRPGEHRESLRVYCREGQPCWRCGCGIVRARIGGRSSFHCPRCQT